MARPRETFLSQSQLTKMDRMAKDQCKHRTIAEVLGVGREALREHYLPRLIKKSSEGRVELQADQRRMQKKHPAVVIFRGKNYLGQTDKQEMAHTGNIAVTIVNYGSKDDSKTPT